MKTTRCLMVMLTLFALGACSASGTSPLGIGQELVGTWSENTTVPGSFLEFTAIVNGTTVTGAGSYSKEGGSAGNLSLSGVIAGSEIQLQLAEDDGTVFHLNARFASRNLLTGGLSTTNDPNASIEYESSASTVLPVTFRRLPRE